MSNYCYRIFKFLLFVIIFNLTFSSCGRNIQEQLAERKIELNPTKSEQIRLSQLFLSADVYNFDIADVVYERPRKIIVKNNIFYFLSKNKIIVSDEYGNLILFLSRRGNGPGDYIEITDFQVEDNGNILVNDATGRKMIRYSTKGEYINTINHQLIASKFIKVYDLIYLNTYDFTNEQLYRVNVWNEAENLIEQKYIKYEKVLKYLSFIEYTNFSFFNDTISYSHSFSNTINQLKNNDLIPRFEIDFGKHNLPKKYTKQYNDLRLFMENFRNSNYASRIDGYREGNDFLFFAYSYQDKMPYVLITKNNNEIHHFDKFEDDFLFPGVIQQTGYDLLPVFIDENYVYVSIEAYRFIELYNLIKTSKNTKCENQIILNEIYNQINDESNSLIIRYKIK